MAENGISSISTATTYPVVDGSWNLRILVTDLQVERTLRVKGELHVGGVMLKLVDELGRTLQCGENKFPRHLNSIRSPKVGPVEKCANLFRSEVEFEAENCLSTELALAKECEKGKKKKKKKNRVGYKSVGYMRLSLQFKSGLIYLTFI